MPSRRHGTTHRLPVVLALGTAQTLAWASTYYLPAMLAAPMADDLGLETPTVFAAFSVALVVSALLGPHAGRAIDRWGARPILAGTNAVFALGLAALANAHGPVGLFSAWIVLGIGMGSGLYEAAFSALVRLYANESRNAITGITLIAGFASTVGWPLSALLEHHFGWRGACYGWAALHLLVGLPLNLRLPRISVGAGEPASPAATGNHPSARNGGRAGPAGMLLATVFAATWFISTAMAAHLPRLLQASGATLAAAVALGALVGPAQVAGRLLEFGLLRRWSPLVSARFAAILHPVGAALLLALGAPATAAFALLHGAGNGILTIANGTLPLVLFGPEGYGRRQGLLMMPARLAQASSPWLFGLLVDRWGGEAAWLSGAVGLVAFAALAALPGAGRQPLPTGPAALPRRGRLAAMSRGVDALRRPAPCHPDQPARRCKSSEVERRRRAPCGSRPPPDREAIDAGGADTAVAGASPRYDALARRCRPGRGPQPSARRHRCLFPKPHIRQDQLSAFRPE